MPLHLPPSPPDTSGCFYWKHCGTQPCHTGIVVARLRPGCGWVLLSLLSLYWLFLPSDIHPFLFLHAVTAFQGSYVRMTYHVSHTGTALLALPGASPLPQFGEDRHRLLSPACHSQSNPTLHAIQVCCTYAAYGRFGTQRHTPLQLSKQTALPHCFVLLSLQQELPQSLQQSKSKCPNSPCGTMMQFWGFLVLDRHQLTEVNIPKLQ